MSEIENPPAFPQSEFAFQGGDGREGMTLRDWFAGQALAGLVANPVNVPAECYSLTAYAIADAMLAERSKREAEQ